MTNAVELVEEIGCIETTPGPQPIERVLDGGLIQGLNGVGCKAGVARHILAVLLLGKADQGLIAAGVQL